MNWDDIKKARDRLLYQCDWTQCADVQANMSESDKQKWVVFRQKLRDLTNDFPTPESVVFPDPPYNIF